MAGVFPTKIEIDPFSQMWLTELPVHIGRASRPQADAPEGSTTITRKRHAEHIKFGPET
jgi:hypothetical protein